MSLFESEDEILDKNPSIIASNWISKNIVWNHGNALHQEDWKRFVKIIPSGNKFIIKCNLPLVAEFLTPLPEWLIIDEDCFFENTIGFIIHSQKDIDTFPSIHRVTNNSNIENLTFYTKANSIIFEGPCQFKNVHITSKANNLIDCRIDSFGYDINNITELHFHNFNKSSITLINPGISQEECVNICNIDKYRPFIEHAKKLNIHFINFAYFISDEPIYISYRLKKDNYIISMNK